MVDAFGTAAAFLVNVEKEYERNGERYAFLRWGAGAFDNFRVVPPGTGICHQVNLEYLSQTVWTKKQNGSARRLPRHAGRHRQPHHDGERPRRARLGRRRHRGRGGHARPADLHADPGSGRLPHHRQAERGRDRHRPRAHRHRAAAARGRGRQVRGVLRRRARQSAAGGSRHHRQHGAGIRRDLRLLPHRRRDARLSRRHRPQGPAHRPGRGLCADARPVSRRRHRRPGVHRHARARSWRRRAVDRRAEAAAGPRAAHPRRRRLRRGARQGIRQGGRDGKARDGAGHQFRSRPWRRGDCRHHLLHQHVEPVRHGGCRPARAQRREARPAGQALGEDLARAGIAGGDRLSREGRLAARSRHARLQPRRLWLHHLHRQFRPAAGGNLQDHPRAWARGRLGAVGQSQFRGPRQSRRARQLPRLAAARGGLRARRLGDGRPHHGAARHRCRRRAGLSQGHLAVVEGDRQDRAQGGEEVDVPPPLRQCVRGRQGVAGDRGQGRADL